MHTNIILTYLLYFYFFIFLFFLSQKIDDDVLFESLDDQGRDINFDEIIENEYNNLNNEDRDDM